MLALISFPHGLDLNQKLCLVLGGLVEVALMFGVVALVFLLLKKLGALADRVAGRLERWWQERKVRTIPGGGYMIRYDSNGTTAEIRPHGAGQYEVFYVLVRASNGHGFTEPRPSDELIRQRVREFLDEAGGLTAYMAQRKTWRYNVPLSTFDASEER